MLAWYAESTIHESYGIFCSWLVETTLVVNIRRLILLNLRDLESSEVAVAQCVSPSKKHNTHLDNLPEFNKSGKNISYKQQKKTQQPTNLPLYQPLQIAILYHPKNPHHVIGRKSKQLGILPTSMVGWKDPIRGRMLQVGVFEKCCIRLKRHFCKFWYGNKYTYRWIITWYIMHTFVSWSLILTG